MNKTEVTITMIKEQNPSIKYFFLKKICMLRTVNNIGEKETVNNYVLGIIREQKKFGEIDFTENKL